MHLLNSISIRNTVDDEPRMLFNHYLSNPPKILNVIRVDYVLKCSTGTNQMKSLDPFEALCFNTKQSSCSKAVVQAFHARLTLI